MPTKNFESKTKNFWITKTEKMSNDKTTKKISKEERKGRKITKNVEWQYNEKIVKTFSAADENDRDETKEDILRKWMRQIWPISNLRKNKMNAN